MAKIIIKDAQGTIVGSFEANDEESVGIQAQDEGIPVPFSCGAGACRTCMAKVKKGQEHLDEEAISMKYITTEDDEVLTCICGVQEDAPQDAEIELQCDQL